MKNTGIVRQVDELGRIVLPMELRRVMGLGVGEPIEVFIDEETKRIMLRKYRTQECLFCQSIETLTYFRGRYVCSTCLLDMKIGDHLLPAHLEVAADYEVLPVIHLPASAVSGGNGKWKRGEIAKRLTEAMEEHPGASQTELAKILGISQGRVSQLMRAQREKAERV